jgi:hypothetical protein
MATFIDNKTRLLGDDLRQEITPSSKIQIVASYFSIYAYQALRDVLKDVEEFDFIFSEPTFADGQVKGNTKKEAREFYIPKQIRESALYGTEFEIKLRNQLTQRALARECAEWLKAKAHFKTNVSDSNLRHFIAISKPDATIGYTGIDGFSASDLGYEKSKDLYSTVVKFDNDETARSLLRTFDSLNPDEGKLQDVTEAIVDYISNVYKENAPQFIYFVTLYNIFSEFLDDLTNQDFMPDERTNYQNSIVWNKLYAFQKDGAVGCINKLEKYNGCILADSVGLGKTFTALGVMKYYSDRNRNILVLTPKRLASNWNQYKDNLRTNLFYADHIRFDVLYHTDLGRTRGFSNGIDLSLFNWSNYDLVVIDESHNFRNVGQYRNHETRYDFLLKKVIEEGVKTKVLMLSATPVNNRFTDLKNQLALAYGEHPEELDEKLDTAKGVAAILSNAQRAFNEWSQLPKEKRHAKDLMDRLDIDFSILLDNVTIARSRKHITTYYDMSEIGNFPRRRKPISYYCDIANASNVIGYDDLFDSLMNLDQAVYAPMNYILPSRLAKYEAKYDVKVGNSTLKQVNREKSLQRLMTINMLKRLESCVDSFRTTLKNVEQVNVDTLKAIQEYESHRNSAVEASHEFTNIDPDDYESEEDFEDEDVETLGKIKIDFGDMDLISYKRDLQSDIEILGSLYELMSEVTPDKDLKLQKLKSIIDEKIANPFNPGNEKVVVFSAFADTVNYLYDNLAPYLKKRYGFEVARVEGGNAGNACTIKNVRDMEEILTLFSPDSKELEKKYPGRKDRIQILFATDCLSEGQNLQDCDECINYDIHWNPVRIVQRFGRIDRIGSKNESIQLINFWPNVSLDSYINLNNRVEARMNIVDATSTGDDNIISDEQVELDYRKEQLKKLQDGKLQDLEDVDGSVAITDLGLNDFRMDLANYIKEHGEPSNVPHGLNAVVLHNDEKAVKKGVIFILRNTNDGVNINNRNRLHPYYLVYLDMDGNVIYDYTQVKKILDVIRTTSKHEVEPIKAACADFNRETKDGLKMDKYSELLESAIKSIIHVKEENDVDTLFSEGSDVLFNGRIKGLDDFELITFFVIK